MNVFGGCTKKGSSYICYTQQEGLLFAEGYSIRVESTTQLCILCSPKGNSLEPRTICNPTQRLGGVCVDKWPTSYVAATQKFAESARVLILFFATCKARQEPQGFMSDNCVRATRSRLTCRTCRYGKASFCTLR